MSLRNSLLMSVLTASRCALSAIAASMMVRTRPCRDFKRDRALRPMRADFASSSRDSLDFWGTLSLYSSLTWAASLDADLLTLATWVLILASWSWVWMLSVGWKSSTAI